MVEVGGWVDVALVFVAFVVVGLGDVDVLVGLGAVVDLDPLPMLFLILSHLLFG